MTDADPLTVALVAVPDATASTLYGMYDLFCSVGRDWDFLLTGVPGPSRVAPRLVAADAAGFRAANGVRIVPDCSFRDCPAPDVVCVPEVLVAPEDDLSGRYPEATAWIRDCYDAGATVASACSGAVLLAEAGLLDGRDATTHWGYCEALGRHYPDVTLHPSRALVACGDGQRIITSGGGTSWTDLALFLTARFFGAEEAMRLAKLYLIDWHSQGQLPFAALARARQSEDHAIGACQEWIADHYQAPAPVAAMTELSGLTGRSFKRRFAKATGMRPIDYVHTLRLEEAKQILETTDLPIEEVAREVGYEDGSFFRRLFRRKVGLSPLEYRRRFAPMRRGLQDARLVG
jgi:transcriptional regulator GlxA family with amidase domain